MIRNSSNASHYTWGDVCDGWRLLDGQDLSVIRERVPPGAGDVRHVHARARQLFFVLAGQLDIEIDGRVQQLSAGDSLEVPPGRSHRVRNRGASDVSFLVISAPATHGDRENLDG